MVTNGEEGRRESEPALEAGDVRRVVRLVSEALAPDDGWHPKVRRLSEGLCDLVDASGWAFVRSRLRADEPLPVNIDYAYGGFTERQFASMVNRQVYGIDGKPAAEAHALSRLLGRGRHFTRTMNQLVSADEWDRPENRGMYEELGLGPHLFSLVPIQENDGAVVFSGLGLLRRPDEPDFDRRERQLVHVVIQECGPLHAYGLRVEMADDTAALSPRLRTVLLLLVEGQSVKEAAYHLGLSRHTVNDYCKQIYRHFDVSSRAELLNRFMRGAETATSDEQA